MKRIAFFVEGQTEQIFVNKLLIEIAGQKNIAIQLVELRGGSSVPKRETIIPQNSGYTPPTNPEYEALIYDSGNDEKVKSDILEQIDSLASKGYSEIIGLQDLYPLPLSDLGRLERGLAFVPPNQPKPKIPFSVVVAVHEMESWFIAECSHFECIDSKLTPQFITTNIGYNPCEKDVIDIAGSAAAELKRIYQLVGKSYTKRKTNVERTVDCIDYANIYLGMQGKIKQLDDLILKIDSFLS